MKSSKSLEVLKRAYILEKKGKAFYSAAAEQATDTTVKEFFGQMAEEEKIHMRIIERQFNSYMKRGGFKTDPADNDAIEKTFPDILSKSLKGKISAVSFEAAAISAAIAFEEKAVNLYSKQAEVAEDPDEKKIYQWLTTWERKHLNDLIEIDKEAVERIWNDNKFWPY